MDPNETAQTSPREASPNSTPRAGDRAWQSLLAPVVLIAFFILLSVFVLIGSAIFGLDKGLVLSSMSKIEFARGLITYLFAVVTIGTAVVLIVSALTGDPSSDWRFQRGKEILSLLLGVFGTIVGFYFGSELSKLPPGEAGAVRVAPLRLTWPEAAGRVAITTVVTGGAPPYRYAVAIGEGAPGPLEPVQPDGWITREVEAPAIRQAVPLTLEVRDANNQLARQTGYLFPGPGVLPAKTIEAK